MSYMTSMTSYFPYTIPDAEISAVWSFVAERYIL